MIRAALGREPRVKRPDSIHTFPDHLTLAPSMVGISAEAVAGIKDLRDGHAVSLNSLVFTFTVTRREAAREFATPLCGKKSRNPDK